MTEVASRSSEVSKNADALNPAFKEWSQVYSYIELNPDSFTTWEDLLEIADGLEGGLCKASSINALRLFRFSYDSFLDRFPLSHGYWIKYAELEFSLGNTSQALAIYEKAISVLPLCVELWTKYCIFKNLVSPSIISTRSLFERGASIVGFHYLSHPFWDEYIKFEQEKGTEKRLINLYKTIIQRPIHQYAKYFTELAKLLPNTPIDQFVTLATLDQFKLDYQKQLESKPKDKQKDESAEDKSKATEGDVQEVQTEDQYLRDRVAKYYDQMFQKVQAKSTARWTFESELQRHFFYVLYIPEEELVAWRQYLHFIEMSTDEGVEYSERIAVYERSIITFGHYEEFWLRYTRWLLAHKRYNEAREVYRRAGYVLPIGRIQVRLQYALFEESQGNIELAKGIYQSILEAMPTLVEVLIGYTGLLHRTEDVENAIKFLESKIELLKSEEEPKEDEKQAAEQDDQQDSDALGNNASLPILYVFLANMYSNWLGSSSKARSILQQASADYPTSYHVWQSYLKFEIEHSQFTFGESQGGDGLKDGPKEEPEKKKGRPSKKQVAKSEAASQQQQQQQQDQQQRVQEIYQEIKQRASLKKNEAKDLAHMYMVYLLSKSGKPNSVQEYFQVDRDAHE